MSVSPSVMRRVMRELSELQKSPLEGVRVQTNDEDMLDFTGIVEGPEGTPYAGGYFMIKFKFTDDFPAAPPKCRMMTKIFHPNVSSAGEICVNTLKKDWKSTYGIGHILVTVKCLLIYPNPESALDEEAGKLLLENYSSYCSRAKLITSIHATPRVRPVEFDVPSAEGSPEPSDATPDAPPAPEESSEPIASTSKTVPIPTSPTTPLTLPIITRKSSSPAPQPQSHPLKATASNLTLEKETGVMSTKERHPSPSPLGTADANVGSKSGNMIGMGRPGNTSLTGTKAVKRSATGIGATGAEKRKKALKRL